MNSKPAMRLFNSIVQFNSILGNVWLAKKDTVKSLGHFEKAVSLRPGVQRAQEMVRRLNGASQSR